MTFVNIAGCLCIKDSNVQNVKSTYIIMIRNLRFVPCAMHNIAYIVKTLWNYSPKINYVKPVNKIRMNHLEHLAF